MATATAVGSTVEVIGCTSNTETIELYFENKRRSGGGTISNLRRKGNVVLVTFDDPEAAERVAAQTHTLEGQELKVKLRATENIDNTTLIVKKVSRETTDDGLGYFLKDVTGSNVVHIDRERSRRTATVKFKPAIDVLEVIQEFDERSAKKKVLDRAELQLFPVNETRTVIIRHLPKGVSEDWIGLYFENKRRSGGGDIDDISLDPSRTSAKVTFTESATIDEVIRRSHSFEGHSLSLSVFYEGVGDDSDESPYEDDDVVEDSCQSLEEDTPPVKRKQYVARKGKPSLERERTQQKAYMPPKKHLTDVRPEYTVPIDGDIIHFIEANKGYLTEFRDAMAAVDATTTRDIGEDTIRVVASKDVNGKSSKEDWEITSQTALAGVFGGYSKVSVPVVPQLWDEVLNDLEEVSHGVLKMKMDDREHEIQLIGKSSEVENARKKIQHAVQAHLEKMDRESRRKTSKINQQNRGKLFVLRQRLDAIRARHTDVDISIDLKLGHVTFTGCQEHEVQSAKCDVYQAFDSIIEKRFRLKTFLASFLEGKPGKQRLLQLLKERKLGTWVEIQGSEIIIAALTKDRVKEAHEFIQGKFKVAEETSKEDISTILELEEFHALVSNLQKTLEVEINFGEKTLSVAGPNEGVDTARKRLRDFIQANLKTSDFIRVDPSILRYIKAHKDNDSIEGIRRKLYTSKGKMAVKENGILLEGNPEVTGDAKREINKILSAVEKNKKEIRIKNQGRCKLFIAGRGEDLVRSVEHKVACAIQVKKQGKFSESKDTRGLSTARTIREKPSSNILEKNGKKITVKQGDISNERVDVIVNSISGDMESPFKGGISQAIFSKAGNDLLTATQALGTMQVGDVKSTVSGRLKCREVYHCVLDKYYGGKGKRILRSVVKEVLNQASQSRFTSIAFPSLGTGYLGFPPQQVAEVMFQEALHFANKHKYSSLKDIRFIVFNAESVDAFQGEIGLYHDVDNDHTISHHASGLQSSEGKTHATFGKITLDLKQGDLTKESVDAIVNPVIPNTYEQSQVGIAIIRAGGNDITREYERSKHDLSTGPIITGSGNLRNINNIIHIVCPKAHDLKRSVEKCLSLAENCLMSSVALPAIGSGHFGLSPAESASGIIEGVKHYAITSPQTLKTVKVVVFQAEMMSDFAKKLGQISQDGRPSDGRSRDGNAQTRPSYPQQGPPQVTITIFADNGGDLAQAEREINKILDEEVITDYIVDDSISKLKDEEFKQVKAIGTTNHVDVSMDTVDGSGNLPDILNKLRVSIVGQKKVLRLEGLKIDVATYKTQIHNWLEKLSAAKETQKSVHWYYFDGRKRQEFPALWNFDLETARLMRNTRMELLGEDGNPVYRVDLHAMRETHIKTHRKFNIQREGPDDSSVKYPKTWDNFPHKHKDNEPYRVTLSDTSKEYKTVEADFLQKSGTSNLTVQQIERIQHELQYQIYSLRRKALTQKYPKQEIEKTLYHGTKADSVDPIIRRGFNRSYAGSSVGAWEGQGAYFAVRSQYSLKKYYSPVDPNTGNRFMFQVKVLVGKTCVGREGIVEPDLIPGTTDRYDTTTDNISNPNMFVTFHDEQAYPEYLITFK